MTLVVAQVSIAADSLLPRDRFVNTLHFNDKNLVLFNDTDWNGLASDLAGVWDVQGGQQGAREIDVRLYDLEDAKPRPIKGRSIHNANLAPASNSPRELACCLSFYAERNLPRQRGRIYIPAMFGETNPGVRPGPIIRDRCLDIGESLAGLGGIDVDWCVYSRLDNVHRKVTNCWVDDEWDVVRSRGLRPTIRDTRATGG